MDIPFKSYARPEVLTAGDMIALYAGNDEPRYVATVLEVIGHDAGVGHDASVTVITDDGRYTVPPDSQIWVVAWAPLPVQPTTPAYIRHAARFAPMGVR